MDAIGEITECHVVSQGALIFIYSLTPRDRDQTAMMKLDLHLHQTGDAWSSLARQIFIRSRLPSDGRDFWRLQKSGSIAWSFLDGSILIERSRCSAILEFNRGDTWIHLMRDRHQTVDVPSDVGSRLTKNHDRRAIHRQFIRLSGDNLSLY